MSVGAMGREKGLWCCWCLVLWPSLLLMVGGDVSSELYNKTCASQCGIITNISYPFRLPHDPPNCGLTDFELACENNVTLLHLHLYNSDDVFLNGTHRVVGTYRVVGINYDNLRIKLVDPGIQAGNCSSLPLYSLSKYDFNHFVCPYDYYEYTLNTTTLNPTSTISYLIEGQVAYLNCSDPVRDDTAFVDTAPCVKGGGHLYAVTGDLLVPQFQPQCRLEFMTPISIRLDHPDWGIKSYADIHTNVSSGFELSWWRRHCADTCPYDDAYCGLSNGSPVCFAMGAAVCTSPLGIVYESCRELPRLRIFAEDYLVGIMKGIPRISRLPQISRLQDDTNYDSGPSKLLFKLGVFTGIFVLPFITFITVKFFIGVVPLSILLIYTCRRRHLSTYEDIEDFIRLHDLIPIRYSYKDLKTMTENFKNKLGEGGFATVYKGKLRSGPDVAIKMLGKSNKASNGQDFMSEVATIGRIHHFNVVHLVGFCVEGTKRALIYEFMSRGSLDKHIFSKEENKSLSYRKI